MIFVEFFEKLIWSSGFPVTVVLVGLDHIIDARRNYKSVSMHTRNFTN